MIRVTKTKLAPGERIRALVVDDSVIIRRLVTHALGEDPNMEVVGSAANGVIALKMIPLLRPHVVTLDIEMPEMDGLETLRNIRKSYPNLIVIMFSTLSERGAVITLEALTLGANDYVTKPANSGSLDQSMIKLRNELMPKFKQFFTMGSEPVAAPSGKYAGTSVLQTEERRGLELIRALTHIDKFAADVSVCIRRRKRFRYVVNVVNLHALWRGGP